MILVTGGTGYIGSHAAVALIAAGRTPVLADNLSNSKAAVVDRIAAIAGERPPFHPIDLRDRAALDAVFREHSISAVMHFAGLKAVGESVAEPLRYYENNLDATFSLCAVMAARGVKRLIFSSSATVYGDPPTVPIREDFPLAPANPYGRTKLMIEQILRDLQAADPAWRIGLLRYFNPVGAHESGLIGEDPQGIPNNLMPFISQVAVGRRERLDVFGDDYPTPDGTGVRDYIHVMDLAEGHVAALSCLENAEASLRRGPGATPDSLSRPEQAAATGSSLLPRRAAATDPSIPSRGESTPDSCAPRGPESAEEASPGDFASAPLVINLGAGRGYSVLEMVRAFEAASGRPIPYRIVGRRPGDIAICYADPSRARTLLGWRARRTLADMCADTWRWQSANPDGFP